MPKPGTRTATSAFSALEDAVGTLSDIDPTYLDAEDFDRAVRRIEEIANAALSDQTADEEDDSVDEDDEETE